MSIVSSASIVRRAHEHGYAVPQINTNGANEDLTRAIVEAAEQMRAPVILGAYEANLQYRGIEFAGMLMRWFAQRAAVPVAIHLDHGGSLDVCRQAIDAGFTSVMIDGSTMPIEDNISTTRSVVALARPAGISVEAEIGELQQLQPDGSIAEVKNLSDPDEVRRMSRETGIDLLAVGIGNAHGFYKGQPDIRFDLLERLAAASTVPLVLHGGTGLEDDVIRRCVSLGMAKLNVGTLLRTRYVEYTAEAIKAGDHGNHPWRVSKVVKERLEADIRRILEIAGAAGQAENGT